MVAAPSLRIRSFKYRRRIKRRSHRTTYRLVGKPQRRAICLRVDWAAPKKPNSARRKIAKVAFAIPPKAFVAMSRRVIVYIPGERGQEGLQMYSTVLVQGGRVKDMPGIFYRVIRGKFDSRPTPGRTRSRSRYGVRRPKRS